MATSGDPSCDATSRNFHWREQSCGKVFDFWRANVDRVRYDNACHNPYNVANEAYLIAVGLLVSIGLSNSKNGTVIR